MSYFKRSFVVALALFAICVFGQPAFAAQQTNINTATVEQLMALPGIGPVMAQRIDEYRQNKQFATVDELVNVQGVGPAILEKLRDLVTVVPVAQQ